MSRRSASVDRSPRMRGRIHVVPLVLVCGVVGFGLAVTAVRTGEVDDPALALAETRQDLLSAIEWYEAELGRELEARPTDGSDPLAALRAGSDPLTEGPRRISPFPSVLLWIDALSPVGVEPPWIEIVAASEAISGGDWGRQLRRRFSPGTSPFHEAAFTAQRAECTSCHLEIVGAEAKVQDSDSFLGRQCPLTASSPSNRSPTDGSLGDLGIAVDWSRAARESRGRVWHEAKEEALVAWPRGVWVTPRGARFENPQLEPRETPTRATDTASTWTPRHGTSVPSPVPGHLVLNGTREAPIHLEGPLWVDGDLVVRGWFTGRGTLIARRNIYVVGDVRVIDGPSPEDAEPDSGPSDFVRFVAAGTIVIGDWTYREGPEDLERQRDRQGQWFIWEALALGRASDGVDHLDEPLGRTELAGGGVRPARYDAQIAPGEVAASGAFQPWLEESTYRELLGDEVVYDFVWRAQFDSRPAIAYELQTQRRQTNEIWRLDRGESWFDPSFFGRTGWGLLVQRLSESDFLVLETGPVKAKSPIRRIDAFLVAGDAIVGALAPVGSTTIRGGLVAPEIHLAASGGGAPAGWRRDPDFALPALRWEGTEVDPTGLRIIFDERVRTLGIDFTRSSRASEPIGEDRWETEPTERIQRYLEERFAR